MLSSRICRLHFDLIHQNMYIYLFIFRADGKIKHCRIELDGRLFAIGSAEFESLIDLVKYYEKNPLYNKVKLKIPVSQSLVESRGTVSIASSICNHSN